MDFIINKSNDIVWDIFGSYQIIEWFSGVIQWFELYHNGELINAFTDLDDAINAIPYSEYI